MDLIVIFAVAPGGPQRTVMDRGPTAMVPPADGGVGVGRAAGSKVSSSPYQIWPGSGRRDDELERLPPGVDQDEEVVVEQRGAVRGPVGVVGAVEVDGRAQRALASAQSASVIGRARRGVPAQFGGLGAGQEPAAAEDRVGPAQRDQPPGEGQQLGVDARPSRTR